MSKERTADGAGVESLIGPRLTLIATGGFCVVLLALFTHSLAPSWNDATSYYSHSWVVGGVAMILLVFRWKENGGCIFSSKGKAGIAVKLPIAVLVACVVVIFVARMVWSVDVNWRPPLWAQAVATVTALSMTIYLVSGRQAVRATLPVAVLLLLCVPWPSVFEQAFVNFMTETVVDSSAFFLRAVGTPVTSVGNALFVSGQQLMVAEGCSGLRSFQGSLAAALLIAEYFAIRPLSRVLLVVAALLAAFLFNSARVLLLAKIADDGESITGVLHDRIGNFTIALLFALIFVMAALLERHSSGARQLQKVAA